jgi:hypothetical protein
MITENGYLFKDESKGLLSQLAAIKALQERLEDNFSGACLEMS